MASPVDHVEAAKQQLSGAEASHDREMPKDGERRTAIAQAHATIAVAEALQDLGRAVDASLSR